MYPKFMQQDVVISISDTEKYLALFETEKMKFPFKKGTEINGSGFEHVLKQIARSGESFINYVPKEITGTVKIKSVVIPVYDQGKQVGAVKYTTNAVTLYATGTSNVTTYQLKTSVTSSSKLVTFESSNSAVVKVDANGKLTAGKAGTATITAKAGNANATCKATVKKPVLTVSR